MTPNPRQGYATSDPRTIITPDAFSVSQDLVGTPLASPVRRLAAILVDLVIAGLFSLLGWYALGVAVVFGAFRAAFFRKTDASAQVYTAFKVVLGCFGTIILIILLFVVGAIFFPSDERFQDALGEIDVPVPSEGTPGDIGTGPGVVDEDRAQLDLGDLLGGLAGIAVLAQASDSAEGHQALVPLLERMFSAGIEGDDARDLLAEVGPSEEPWWEGALSGAIGEATLRSAEGAPAVPGADTSQAVEEPADAVSLGEGAGPGHAGGTPIRASAFTGGCPGLPPSPGPCRGGPGGGGERRDLCLGPEPVRRPGPAVWLGHRLPDGLHCLVGRTDRWQAPVRHPGGPPGRQAHDRLARVRAGRWVRGRVRHRPPRIRAGLLGPESHDHP